MDETSENKKLEQIPGNKLITSKLITVKVFIFMVNIKAKKNSIREIDF